MEGMQIKKFVGQTFKEAIEAAKREFGPDVMIIQTREIKGGGAFGILNKKLMEVTAAIDRSLATPPDKPVQTINAEEVLKGLRELKDEIGFLKETLRPVVPTLKIGKEKKGLYNLLIRQGVEGQLALILVERANEGIDSLKKVITQDMKVQGLSPSEERGMIFLGPPGVGKTTTLSKIAHMIHSKKRPVGIITLDDNRISTMAHFKEVSRMLHCPVKNVKKMSELPKLLYKEMQRVSLLIDTPGYDFKETLHGLSEIFPSGFPLKKCLVMDASMNEQTVLRFWQDCMKYGIDNIGFTKLDLASHFGGLYNMSVITGRPLSFMTTGPDIPKDIRIPTPEFLASLVVGGV
jgi:flagellar biosynthesis protein FlhF